MDERTLLLASTSKYRAELLSRLGLPFETAAPGVDETALPGEAPDRLAARLAQAKAHALVASFPGRLVIGSDQVLALGDQLLGKPGDHDHAVLQLRQLSGATAVFYTAVCVIDSTTAQEKAALVPVTVSFRSLTDDSIQRYLRTERPYDVAGSAKSEGLGIALLHKIDSDDPTALIGLPLIALVNLLAQLDYHVLDRIGTK